MKTIQGGVTAAKGYLASGGHCGAKRKNKDLALILSQTPAHMAAVFTTNQVKAAPVLWNKDIYDQEQDVRAIVVNSGNANACTGELGVKHTKDMAKTTADILGVQIDEVLVASTGVIGVPLPIDTICKGIHKFGLQMDSSLEAGEDAANAIRTTDTYSKELAVVIYINGTPVTIGGMAKGSGMIHPNMATMLGFITTDLDITSELFRKALTETVDDTYNMISVDGDTSTNDMVIALANGEAGNAIIDSEDEAYGIFKKALLDVNEQLAKMIVGDGEGVTKCIEVSVTGAKTKEDAKLLSKSVITSNLVKTAFFGEDANWGRILCAMGYSGVTFNPDKVSLYYTSNKGKIMLVDKGMPISFSEQKASSIMSEHHIGVDIVLEEGTGEAKAWGCDLSYEYVRINGEYRT